MLALLKDLAYAVPARVVGGLWLALTFAALVLLSLLLVAVAIGAPLGWMGLAWALWGVALLWLAVLTFLWGCFHEVYTTSG